MGAWRPKGIKKAYRNRIGYRIHFDDQIYIAESALLARKILINTSQSLLRGIKYYLQQRSTVRHDRRRKNNKLSICFRLKTLEICCIDKSTENYNSIFAPGFGLSLNAGAPCARRSLKTFSSSSARWRLRNSRSCMIFFSFSGSTT